MIFIVTLCFIVALTWLCNRFAMALSNLFKQSHTCFSQTLLIITLIIIILTNIQKEPGELNILPVLLYIYGFYTVLGINLLLTS